MFNRYYSPSLDHSTLDHHNIRPKVGVLLVNLGSPSQPTSTALRPYLRQFLSDPRVIEVNPWKWFFILRLFILTFRPGRSAKLYRNIWQEQGSPLIQHSLAQASALQSVLSDACQDRVLVRAAMRIGKPSMSEVMEQMAQAGVTRLLVIPMFPQYSGTTTGSVFDELASILQKWRWVPELRFLNSYHDSAAYIEALAESVESYWNTNGIPDRLLLSFHGIPVRYFMNGDPYFCYCQKTARLLKTRLANWRIPVQVSFQSLFGKEPWLKPYTDEVLVSLAKTEDTSVDVMCPGFSADCLETIDEISREARETFIEAGGKNFRYIPCLNARQSFIEALKTLVLDNTKGWFDEVDLADPELVKEMEKEFSSLCRK